MRWSRVLRWLIFVAAIVGMDVAALSWVIATQSFLIYKGGVGKGSRTRYALYLKGYDGSFVEFVVSIPAGKTIRRTVIRPPSALGVCRVWGPAVAAGVLTLLAVAAARTRTGRWVITERPLPRMTTRRWMIVVAVVGTELGLFLGAFRDINPWGIPWTLAAVNLVLLHAVVFLPVGVVLLFRLVWSRRGQDRGRSASGSL